MAEHIHSETDAEQQERVTMPSAPLPARRQLLLVGVVAVPVFIAAIAWWMAVRTRQTVVPAPATAVSAAFRPTPEQLRNLEVGTVEAYVFPGAVLTDGRIVADATRSTPVYSPFTGRVTRLLAAPGDDVAPGAGLAEIEAGESVQAQSDFANAQSQLALASASEARKRALYEARGASLADWQQSQSDLRTAETALQAAHARLRILGADMPLTPAGDPAAPVSAHVLLRAPIRGYVVDRQLGPGQYVQAGATTPLFTIANTRSVWLVANVPEGDAARVRRGQPVRMTVPAWPGRVFDAVVDFVAAGLDPQTHRLPVRATVSNTDGLLRPEMLAEVRVLTGDGGAATAVPDSAVVHDGASARVWVLVHSPGGDLIQSRRISVGRVEDHRVEVLVGLRRGERIITRGALFIDQATQTDGS